MALGAGLACEVELVLLRLAELFVVDVCAGPWMSWWAA
jgi:hypothetical protein